MAEEKVMMPMGSAGIIGFSPDIKLSGFEIDPKVLIISVFAFVLLIKLASLFMS
jgi:preprotein translocase subunit Sec61beta